MYTGQFKAGKRHGQGECKYGNGKIYTGEWKDGENHGKGKMVFTIEQYVREGYWQNGRMEGEQVITYKTGEQRKQLWQNFKLVKDDVIKEAD